MWQGGASAVDQEGTKVLVPSFADSKQALLATGRLFARDEAHPGGHVAAFVESSRVAYRSYQRRCVERADPGNLTEPTTRLILLRAGGQFGIQGLDPCIQITPFGAEVFDQKTDAR